MATKYPGVRPRGNSIQIDFKYRGIRCRETLKMKPTAENLKAASAILGKIQFDIVLNKLVYSEYFPNSNKVKVFGHKQISNMTVSQALDWWWEKYKPNSERTLIRHEVNIRLYIKPSLGDILLCELKAKHVKDWIQSEKLSNLSISSRNSILTPLRKMFAEAYSEELVDEDIKIGRAHV